MNKAEEALQQVEASIPAVEAFKCETRLMEYVLCVDTLGRDSELGEGMLGYVEGKVALFREMWENKEYKMLLADIHRFMEEEGGNEALVNGFMDQDKAIMASNESTIREQYPGREK